MSPWGYVGAGLVLSLIGALWVANADGDAGLALPGLLFLGVGGAIAWIGVVAQGVRLGLLHHQLDLAAAEDALDEKDRLAQSQ